MPTMGLFNAMAPVDPWKVASPNEKIPPSDATRSYPWLFTAAAYEKWSADDVGDVSPATATVTSTVPTFPAGEVAVHCVEEAQLTLVAVTLPKDTLTAPGVVEKSVPEMVTEVPPLAGPDEGATPVTDGVDGGVTYVNWSDDEVGDDKPPTVTMTSTTPALPAGEVAVHSVEESQLTSVAASVPKATLTASVADEKFVPEMVTGVPPPVEPDEGLTPVTDGVTSNGAVIANVWEVAPVSNV
jgi:hypothetical protein